MSLEIIRNRLAESAEVQRGIDTEHFERIATVASWLLESLRSGKKVIWCGNGGSATQAQHMAAEFVGRYKREREALASISLNENIASVTAIANDYGYEAVFERQLKGLAQAGDVLIGLSTSGNSGNVVKAFELAKTIGVKTVAMTGESGGRLNEISDICIRVPSTVTARIQESHLTIGHILCELVDEAFAS